MHDKEKKFDSSKQIIYFSRFHPMSNAGGGCRRTAQIVGALKSLDFAFISSRDHTHDYKKLPEYSAYLQEGGLSEDYINNWDSNRQEDVAFMHFVSWSWSNKLKDSDCLKLALVDDPLYFSPLVKYLSSKGVPVIGLCQNIETLSRSQIGATGQRELLDYELDCISDCSLVVTISREETVFLTNLDISAFYYPYFPVDDIRDRMLSLREKRKNREKEGFLLVGTANNAPTMKGMQEVMQRWSSINKSTDCGRLYVAGYGSEPLKDFADGKDVIFRGALSNEKLDALLANIKACVVYQKDGSGALTKICEFLLAGIPVLANSHSARSYYNLPGVIEFFDLNDFARASKLIDSGNIDVVPPAQPNSHLLVARVKKVLNAGPTAVEKKTIRSRERTDMLAKVRRDIDELKAENLALRAERNVLLNSLSWRITTPLRRVYDVLNIRKENVK